MDDATTAIVINFPDDESTPTVVWHPRGRTSMGAPQTTTRRDYRTLLYTACHPDLANASPGWQPDTMILPPMVRAMSSSLATPYEPHPCMTLLLECEPAFHTVQLKLKHTSLGEFGDRFLPFPWTYFLLRLQQTTFKTMPYVGTVQGVYVRPRPLSAGDDELWPMPLPNIGATGQICMRDCDFMVLPSATEFCNSLLTLFWGSIFNSDIVAYESSGFFLSLHQAPHTHSHHAAWRVWEGLSLVQACAPHRFTQYLSMARDRSNHVSTHPLLSTPIQPTPTPDDARRMLASIYNIFVQQLYIGDPP